MYYVILDCPETTPPSKDSIPYSLQGVASCCKMTILSRAQTFWFIFHVFCPLMRALKSHKFGPNDDIKAVTVQLFQQQPRKFFQR